jgi:hypothetical protein
VPASATAVVLNVTSREPDRQRLRHGVAGGRGPALASSLNTQPGQTRPNLVVAKVGAGGKLSLFTYGDGNGTVDLVADIVGFFGTGGGNVVGTDPASALRLDRSEHPWPVGRPSPAASRSRARPRTPATAVALNVTVTDPNYTGFVTVADRHDAGGRRSTTASARRCRTS